MSLQEQIPEKPKVPKRLVRTRVRSFLIAIVIDHLFAIIFRKQVVKSVEGTTISVT